MGLSRGLKEYNPDIQIIGVEPYLGHKIQGLKNMKESYQPEIYDKQRLDKKVNIDDEEAFEMARSLAKSEGLLVGMSSGAAMAAASGASLLSLARGAEVIPGFDHEILEGFLACKVVAQAGNSFVAKELVDGRAPHIAVDQQDMLVDILGNGKRQVAGHERLPLAGQRTGYQDRTRRGFPPGREHDVVGDEGQPGLAGEKGVAQAARQRAKDKADCDLGVQFQGSLPLVVIRIVPDPF